MHRKILSMILTFHSDFTFMGKVYIYYNCSYEDIRRIEERFGFPHCVTVNGETCKPVEVKPEDWPLLQETEKRGFIQIRRK